MDPNIDLSQASDEDLQQIQNEVLRHVAARARQAAKKPDASLMYDSHGSVHSKNSVA